MSPPWPWETSWVVISVSISPMLGSWTAGFLGELENRAGLINVEVFTICRILTSTGSGITFESGRMMSSLPGFSSNVSPKRRLRDTRRLPSNTRILTAWAGVYSKRMVVPVMEAVTAAA